MRTVNLGIVVSARAPDGQRGMREGWYRCQCHFWQCLPMFCIFAVFWQWKMAMEKREPNWRNLELHFWQRLAVFAKRFFFFAFFGNGSVGIKKGKIWDCVFCKFYQFSRIFGIFWQYKNGKKWNRVYFFMASYGVFITKNAYCTLLSLSMRELAMMGKERWVHNLSQFSHFAYHISYLICLLDVFGIKSSMYTNVFIEEFSCKCAI